ncbi:hypothetical protein LSUE1_G007255 [Lachnellula suecica]|uniref:Altered inheritance of mitochondria protein 21 n=1 Tax=Lachnellula suecica TaxID=602035 RepID=A0A8T9C119_9HELO|nr:hypothetical protein LSUE1_G007255 [Lachnellula suecica]
MSTAMPQVPPRPTRAQNEASGNSSSLGSDIPKIPPRPANRRPDRSISPSRESFARSPLNETPHLGNHGTLSKSALSLGTNTNYESGNESGIDLPRRPSSVNLPTIGQEGNEYAEVFGAPAEQLGASPTQTRNVANDLKLHAPKPSLPVSSAKERVSQVTRTDSGQAASFGIGKANSDDKEPASRDLKTKASFASQVSNGTERPPSSLESEHGIPEIGQRVPMYPNAGDVQAPSPAPFPTPFAPGIGFHNDGSKPRHHARKLSARDHDVPLEAYGRHGHQVLPHDRFEKAYYEKHPELFKKELGQYGEGRPEWAMSSDDLNKIVRDTASRGAGLGTSGNIGTPSEQVGFQATEEYASRISSPRPQSSGFQIAHSNASQTHVDSPLRKASFPTEGAGKKEFENTLSRSLQAPSDAALESELEDDDVIHVDTARPASRVYGSRFESTDSLGIHNELDEEEHDDYHAPILASDEVAKEPFGYELQAAVSPLHERRSSQDHSFYQQFSTSQTSLSGSRPSSRPGSIHGTLPGHRHESTRLEDLEEYEPLFPEDEKNAAKQKPLTAADRLKRPEMKNRKFPSQDIWEDSPNSLQYTATVSTPQLPEDDENSKELSNETPEQAFARRQEALAESEYSSTESFLHQEKKKPWADKSQLTSETRPGSGHRFPSRDIWEDTPDSLQYTAEVAGPQTSDAIASQDESGIPVEKPSIPARPAKSKLSQSPEKSQPAIPERPTKTKPQIPARPAKQLSRDSSESVPLSQVASNSSAKSVGLDQGLAAAAKPKPPVPSRPVGSKIAALQGGFMADLNKRLQLGAQPPKKEEVVANEPAEEKEKAPLADARKGRARGPARRAPAKSPSPAVAGDVAEKSAVLGFSMTSTVWQIDPEEDLLHVAQKEATASPEISKATESETPTLATNIAGQPLHEPAEISPAEKVSSPPSAVEEPHVQQIEEPVATEPSAKLEPPIAAQTTALPKSADEDLVKGETESEIVE